MVFIDSTHPCGQTPDDTDCERRAGRNYGDTERGFEDLEAPAQLAAHETRSPQPELVAQALSRVMEEYS